eukprot:TRINITY_DN66840_c6_g2_i1.p1 TRINITY_DN66840_c6_g2~~TRINITY_DN66840_c6_g2_i1.p1  ORF type:complete len:587 (+),score=66.32 TRINITY_DN66840_c6_g2_i1:237-1763(+)
MAHIQPDRRWFGNTKVIAQQLLQDFREEMQKKFHDPYSVVLNARKLPTSLITDPKHDDNATPKKLLDWKGTYTQKKSRKKASIKAADVEQLVQDATDHQEKYGETPDKDKQTLKAEDEAFMADKTFHGAEILKAGQSGRIWNELYKVIDSSDVLLMVLDARDPMGTRCAAVEKYLKKEKKFKSLIFVLNKIDLVPEWSHRRWTAILSTEYPTIPFQSSITNPHGKGNLISLVRQYSKLFKQNRNSQFVSVGLIGYPNVGKSSVINTIRGKKVCNVAPIPGETKVWQYVALSKRVYLIDCPGVIHSTEGNTPTEAILKGVVRVERLGNEDKTDHIATVLTMIDKQKMADSYGIEPTWRDQHEFLDMVATARGKLLPGGVPDADTAARMVLFDWQRARLPWFHPPPHDPSVPPPAMPDSESESEEEEAKQKPKQKAKKPTPNKTTTSTTTTSTTTNTTPTTTTTTTKKSSAKPAQPAPTASEDDDNDAVAPPKKKRKVKVIKKKRVVSKA